MIELSEEQLRDYRKTAQTLKGSERRRFMARVVQTLGRGGQRYVEKVFGWNRRTIRKGMTELTSGIMQTDHFSARGRKRMEAQLPHLLADLRELMESQAVGLSATALRQQLIEQKGYAAEALPCVATLRKRLKELGYPLRSARNRR